MASSKQALLQLEEIDHTKKKLTLQDEFALQAAHQKVSTALDAQEQAQGNVINVQDQLRASGNKVQTMLAAVAKATKGQADAASSTWTGHLKALRAEIENHVTEIGQKYGPAITAVGAGMAVAGQAANGLKSMMGMLRGGSEAAAAAQSILTASQEAGTVAADGLAASEVAVDTAGAPLILIILAVIAVIALVVAAVYELVTHWKQVFATMKAVVEECWHFIDSVFVQPIKQAFSAVVDFIKQHWQLLVAILLAPIAPVLSVFLLFHNQIIGFFQRVVDFIGSVPGKIVNFFTGLPDKIMGEVGSLLGSMESFGENLVSAIVRGVAHMGSAIFDEIKKHIPGSGVIGGIAHTIGLAEGGIVTKPTLAVIAEAGYPEAVIPLKNGLRADASGVSQLPQSSQSSAKTSTSGQGGNTTTQIVNIAAMTNASAADISQEITWSMSRLAA